MAQEDKKLLLQDLCARLPYGVKCENFNHVYGKNILKVTDIRDNGYICGIINNQYCWAVFNPLELKPYLFPLSSMTEEQKMFLRQQNWCIAISTSGTVETTIEGFDWLNKNHFDYRGFIEKSLALDATNLGIYDEQKPTDKVEPIFHEGDWVVFNNQPEKGSIYQIKDIHNYEYTLQHILGGSMPVSFSSENMLRLWTISDAKDGDVVCYKDEISLYKHDIKNCTKREPTFGGFVYHCCYDGKRFITDCLYSLTEQDKMNIHPATKEQRDLLFTKMKEAGYEWIADKKELRKVGGVK